MKQVLKNATLAVASIALLIGSVAMMQKSKAAANLLTGKCGGVFNLRTAADGATEFGSTRSISASFIVDFDLNTATVASTRQNRIDANDNIWTQDVKINKSFNIAQDPDGMIGSYQVTINFIDGVSPDNPVFRLIPVNNNTTFLIQGKTFGATGVCQKV